MIKFGTDGWRALLDGEFNLENVERVALAMGKYIYETFGYDKPVIIGYDPRNMAEDYATRTAELLYQKGFKVKLSSRVVPTPVLAFNAKYLNACAIMFTASHNPADYLGMKFIPDYAGPATSEITDAIVENLDKDYPDGENGNLEVVDFMGTYYNHLKTLIDFEKIKTLNSNIIFDGLYSASIGYFDTILKANDIPFEAIHMEHDTEFGGGMPDPKPKYLQELIEKVKATPNSIGLANDGDADRFGVINENGEFVSPNEIIAILLKYLKEQGKNGSVVKTVGSSILIDIIAKKLDVPVIETAVGFKHVGEAMRENEVIIGGEESGGLSILGHIPEKDGLIANLLILEVMADKNMKLSELQEELYELAECRFYNDRIDLKKSSSDEIKDIIERFEFMGCINGLDVTLNDYTDGVKLMFGEKTKMLVRASGTEPLLRIYFESESPEKIDQLKVGVDEILMTARHN